MKYLGDFTEDSTVYFAFSTNDGSGGRASFSASLEEADIVIFKDGTAMTLDASTITISSEPGSLTGVHIISVDMSNDADFTTGSDYIAVLYPNDETVDSQNVAGVLAQWSCENRSVNVARVGGQDVELSSDNRLSVDVAEWNDIPLSTTNPLPNAAPDAAGGLPISDAGGLDLDAQFAKFGTISDLGSGATVGANLGDIAGATFSASTDSLEAIRDRGDAAWTTGAGGSDRLLMVDTTIATLSSQTSFTLTAGSADDDAYNGCTIVIEDVSTSTQKAVGIVDDYTGSTKTVTLLEDPGVFTMAATDKVYILAEKSLKPTTAANYHVDVTSGGAVGIDWANVENPSTAVDLSATDIQLCDTVTTNSDLVSAASIRTEMDSNSTQLAAIVADTNELQTDWADGGRLDLILDARASQSSVDTVDGIVDAILLDTAEIGAAGAGLTAIPDMATATNQTTIAGYIDTEVGAIKSVTDQMVFTTANQLDVQVLSAATDSITADALNADAATEVATAVMAATGDTGVSVSKAVEMIAALAAGKVSASSAAGVTTLNYKKRDGSTTSFTVVVTESDKTRATTGSLS